MAKVGDDKLYQDFFDKKRLIAGAEAIFSTHAITLGATLGRNDIRGKLTGEGGEAICNGLYLLKDKQPQCKAL